MKIIKEKIKTVSRIENINNLKIFIKNLTNLLQNYKYVWKVELLKPLKIQQNQIKIKNLILVSNDLNIKEEINAKFIHNFLNKKINYLHSNIKYIDFFNPYFVFEIIKKEKVFLDGEKH